MSEHSMIDGDTDDLLSALADAGEALAAAEAAVEEVGEARVRRVADAHDRFDDLLSRYRERASGSGAETFKAYVEFEGALEDFIEGLPDDLPHRGAFEAARDVLDRRRLEERDFDRARDAVAPAREVAALADERDAARDRYRKARRAVVTKRRELDARIDEVESLLTYEDVDFDAPVERLREPVSRYNGAIDDAFDAFLATEPARGVLDFLAATAAYPLVDFEPPPADLRAYLNEQPPGEVPVTTLLEWTGYTRSKLSHYVDDPATFRARVAGNRTYLARLDAGPLRIEWPPPPAESLRFRARELVAVAERFAPESAVSRLHAVRRAAREEDYERLRLVAVAREELTVEDRRRLRDRSAHDELESLHAERDRLADALAEHSVS